MHSEDLREKFDDDYLKCARAVVSYCKETQVTSTAIQGLVSEYTEDTDHGKLRNVCMCMAS